MSEELNRLLRDIEDDYYSMGRMDKADAVAGLVARNAVLEAELAEFRKRSAEVIDILDQPAPDTKAEPDDPDAPKVTGSPAEIWLVYGDIEEDCAHVDCGEVSWCGEQQFPADVRYVRADLASRASPSQPVERIADAILNASSMGEATRILLMRKEHGFPERDLGGLNRTALINVIMKAQEASNA